MKISEVNISFFRQINDLGTDYTFLNPPMIFFAEYLVFVLAIAVCIIWFTKVRSNRIMIICATISFGLAEILGKLSGMLYSNLQPFAELTDVNKLIEKAVDNSFPSDHTILFFSFCVTFWLFRKGWWFLWIILSVIVGISRIWVGVHYPADVLAGASLSLISATLIYYIVPRLKLTQYFLDTYEKIEHRILSPSSKSKGSKSKDI